jgi:hypothetical protein
MGARAPHRALGGLVICLVVAAGAMSCARPFPSEWGQGAKLVDLDRKQAQGFWMTSEAEDVESARFDILVPLSKVFYERTTNRRVNSKATFDDPALREFFHDPSAFADYYANLVEALDRAYFESHKPTAVKLVRIERLAPKRVAIEVTFRGRNRKPLRFWNTEVTRTDEWEFAAGRWWVIPGKV